MTYYLVMECGLNGEREIGRYDLPQEASAVCKRYTSTVKQAHIAHPNQGYDKIKYRVKKVEPPVIPEWHKREQARLCDGTYNHVPWQGNTWAIVAHFAHVSTEDPMMLAFTPDNAHGESDRQVRIRPGRYLDRFYKKILDEEQRRKWEQRYIEANSLPELLLAKTENEIEMVYTYGPDSCMQHSASYYQTKGYHPVRIYAAGDLALAYLKNKNNRISARCLVWPEKKIWARIYGDVTRLIKALKANGYQFNDEYDEDGRSSLEGARLLRKPHNGGFIMPYLDSPCQCASDHGSFLVMDESGEIDGEVVNGCTQERYACDNCGDTVDNEDDFYCVNDQQWCNNCYDRDAFYCTECGDNYSNDVDHHEITSHGIVCEGCYTRHRERFVDCVNCSDTFHINNVLTMLNAEHICRSCLNDNACFAKSECGVVLDLDDEDLNKCGCDICSTTEIYAALKTHAELESKREDNDIAECPEIIYEYYAPGLGIVRCKEPYYIDPSRSAQHRFRVNTIENGNYYIFEPGSADETRAMSVHRGRRAAATTTTHAATFVTITTTTSI